MRNILTVTAPNSDKMLTTLARVKAELDISGTDTNRDMLLNLKILEASADISASLGLILARETVSELFWHESGDTSPEFLLLDRTPVASITSVTMDDVLLDASLYRLDTESGVLYALDATGYPCRWYFTKAVTVIYVGGYILPNETNHTLPAGIEGACVELMTDYWMAKGRDPSVKSEEIPGVIRTDYWVGAVGESGELPPRVVMKLAPYRRAAV